MVSTTAARTAPEEKPRSSAVVGAAYDVASRLMDSLLHDARNPLNALAINLEVLTEKLKDEDGQVPASLDKNLKAIRDQVFRADAILRQFSDFIAPRPSGGGIVNLSGLVDRVVEVVSHEARKRRVRLTVRAERGLEIRCEDVSGLNLLVLLSVMRALQRVSPGSEVELSLAREGDRAILRVKDPGGPVLEPSPELLAALDFLSQQNLTQLRVTGGECELIARCG